MANLLKSILLFQNETAVLRGITNFLFKKSKHAEGDIKKHPGDILNRLMGDSSCLPQQEVSRPSTRTPG